MSRAVCNLILLLPLLLLISGSDGAIQICPKLSTSKSDASIEKIPAVLKEFQQKLESANSDDAKTSTSFDYFHFHLSHPALSVDADITNGTLTIEQPKIEYFKILPTGLEIFNLTFPHFDVEGTYNLTKGFIGRNLFNIYGEGNFFFNLKNISISAVSGLTINNSSPCISFEVRVYVEGFNVLRYSRGILLMGHLSTFENFMNNDPDLCPLLNDVFRGIMPETLERIFRDEADGVDKIIQPIIDFIMGLISGSTESKKSSLSSYILFMATEHLGLNTLK